MYECCSAVCGSVLTTVKNESLEKRLNSSEMTYTESLEDSPARLANYLFANADGKLQFRAHAEIHADVGKQIDVVDLMLNDVVIVIHRAPLLIDLRPDHISLVVHLIPKVASVILVIPQINP